jgi:tetratricopeptide (TPR) repeat protein
LTLAEALKAKGLKTAAFVSSFSVDSRFGLDQGFDFYDDKFQEVTPFKSLNSERRAEKTFASFSDWIDKNSSQQFFCWVHFFDPHLPYDPPSPYKEEFAANPYDGEIAYMDHYIGAIIEKLKEKNIFGQTLLILAGDHGEAFGEKVEVGHGVFLYEGTMRVPLVFYAENHFPQGNVVKPRVRLIDIMPTVLDMLLLTNPEKIQGESLLPYIERRKRDDLSSYIETFYPRENYGWSELIGLISGNWKYIRAPKEELYNLRSDPNEEKNAFSSSEKIASEMKRNLESLIKSEAAATETKGGVMSAEAQDRLRSLGYISFSEKPGGGHYPDPKDKLDELRMNQEAEMYELQKNYLEARRVYEKLLKLRPNSASSYVNLALAQARLNEFEGAVATLKDGIEKIPKSEILISRLGHTYLAMGKMDESLAAMKQVLEVAPRSFDALLVSGLVLDRQGRKEEAQGYFEEALEIEPENKFLRTNYALNLITGRKIPQAIDAFTGLVRDYPDDYRLSQYLGIAYAYLGNYAKAIESLKQAIYIHPTPIAYYNLAVAYREIGEVKEAIHYLELYLENPQGEDERSIKQAQNELQNLKKMLK